MVQGVNLPREELQRRFGLSSRLTARVGALMARGLQFTEAALELAGSEQEMAGLLLAPEFLDQAAQLTTARARRLGEKLGLQDFMDRNPLRAVKEGEVRILALKDEVEAASVWEEPQAEGSETAVAIVESAPSAPAEGLGGLISDEQAAELKLTILTSADPNRKIEAIRRLVFSSLSPEEKGRLFVSALSDDSTQVRLEATRALRSLGLDSELALQIRQLFQGEGPEREIAASALRRFARQGSMLERAVIFVVVSKALGEESFADFRLQLLEVVRNLVDLVAANDDFLTEGTSLLLGGLSTSSLEVYRQSRNVLSSLIEAVPERVCAALWERLPDVAEPRARAAVICAIGSRAPEQVQADELARAAVSESLRFSELDAECWQLRALAARLGEAAAAPALQMLASSAADVRIRLLRLIDTLCIEARLSTKSIGSIGQVLLDALSTGSEPERISLLDLPSLTDSRFPASVRRRIAAELLATMDSVQMARTLDLVQEALISLGPVAIEPIIDYVGKRKPSSRSTRPLQALGEIASEMSAGSKPEQKAVADAVAFCLKLVGSDGYGGAEMTVLGQLCSRDFVGPRTVQSAARLLRKNLRTSSFPFQAVDGLGWLASNPTLPPRTRLDIAHSLLHLFESKLPEDLLRERATDEGTVFDVGPEASAYNYMIPAAIAGLARICNAAGSDQVLSQRIIDSLLHKWQQLHTLDEVWGPANAAALADALGEVAAGPSLSTSQRISIVKALAADLGRMSVVRVLGEILSLDGGSPELGAVAKSIGEELLDVRLAEEGLAPEEREALLKTLTSIALRPDLGGRSPSAARFRACVVTALEARLRDHLTVAHDGLAKLAESEALSEFQRKEIRRRLSRFERIVPL